jgi:hypothetical protein
MAGNAPAAKRAPAAAPFPLDDLRAYLDANSAAVPYPEIADSLRKLSAEVEHHYADLEALEQRLTVLEEKMLAIARTTQTEEQMLASRQELDRQLRPYRGKMTADQLSMLEKQYLERNLLEKAKLPRLSLFYLR